MGDDLGRMADDGCPLHDDGFCGLRASLERLLLVARAELEETHNALARCRDQLLADDLVWLRDYWAGRRDRLRLVLDLRYGG